MSLIQIRNVPEAIHRRAKARAALEGLTLSDYALRAVERELREPTLSEIAARIRTLDPVDVEPPAARVVREERDAR
jgi:plasmid stability protein